MHSNAKRPFVVTFGLFFVGMLSCLSASYGLSRALLSELDFPSPFCEEPVNLSVARETFNELEQDLPGVQAYNEIVRLYRAHEWDKIDDAVVFIP